MYRQGLGDCFLVLLPRENQRCFSILIDCGVLLGTKEAQAKMLRVARDIAQVTEKHLDVVVATHEHWDHLSGFLQAREVFDELTIGEVWLAWTEDPADTLAKHLRQQRQQAMRALYVVASRLAELDPEAASLRRSPLAFFKAKGSMSTSEAMEYLVHHPKKPRVRYLTPGGATIELPVEGAARAFVLGPPRDEQLIHRSNPTKSGKEVYALAQGMALFAAAGAESSFQEDTDDRFHAFERLHRRRSDEAAFFQSEYFRSANEWRRIDTDWLGVADQLALALDNHTNNTSLAFALELEPRGRVLLFPGDAQVGNWLSWHDHRWPSPSRRRRWIDAADLLKRTVLYKVGHHGSHNATLREQGLERMVHQDLAALVPVDKTMAERKRWNMPFPALYERLQQLARGRVLRADEDIPQRPEGVSAAEWKRFVDRVGANDLYYDYTIPSRE